MWRKPDQRSDNLSSRSKLADLVDKNFLLVSFVTELGSRRSRLSDSRDASSDWADDDEEDDDHGFALCCGFGRYLFVVSPVNNEENNSELEWKLDHIWHIQIPLHIRTMSATPKPKQNVFGRPAGQLSARTVQVVSLRIRVWKWAGPDWK